MLKRIRFVETLQGRIAIVTLAVFLAAVWAVTYIAMRQFQASMTEVLGEQLLSTVSVVARQLDSELSARLHALERLAGEIEVQQLGDMSQLESNLAREVQLLSLFNAGLSLIDKAGKTIVHVPSSAQGHPTSPGAAPGSTRFGEDQRGHIERPFRAPLSQEVTVGMTAPILDHAGNVAAYLRAMINLEEPSFFEAVTRNQLGKTGGYLIIAPQHELIIAGTERSRFLTPMPAPGVNPNHDRFVAGYEGFGIAVNSRGIREIAAAKTIAVADWFLVGVLPTTEAFAPIDQARRNMLWSSLAFSILAGLLAWWFVTRQLRQQFAPILSATRSLSRMARSDGVALEQLRIERQDEFGALVARFNQLVESLAERESRLLEQEQHFWTLANCGAALIWTSDTAGKRDYFNEPWLRFTGRTLEQEIGDGWGAGVHPEDKQACLELYSSHLLQRTAFRMEYRLRHADGRYRWLFDEGTPRYDSSGRCIGYIGYCYDIDERKRVEAQLRQAASVFDHANQGIMITDPSGKIVDVNRAFTRITGFSRDEALGNTPRLLSSGAQDRSFYEEMWRKLGTDGQWTGEIWNRRKDGQLYAELLTISHVRDERGQVQHYVALFSDISTQKAHQHALERIVHFDALTGLPNRSLLNDRLQQAMSQAMRRHEGLAVAFIDLDGFKAVNDTYGHDVGDRLLKTVASRMRALLRESDTLARIGGDEFVAILPDLIIGTNPSQLLLRLLEAANEPMVDAGRVIEVTASVGVSLYPQTGPLDADELIRQADEAMYQAKLAGKNRFCLFGNGCGDTP